MSDDDALIADARREERRGRLTLEDLQRNGPPVRLRDLCDITGFSKMKFLDDIERGRLEARWVETCSTRMAIVDRDAALRYLASIGFAA